MSRRLCGSARFRRTIRQRARPHSCWACRSITGEAWIAPTRRSVHLLTRLPLTEVYNNLGVVDARRGRRAAAVGIFLQGGHGRPQRCGLPLQLRLGVVQERGSAGAARQLREELQRRPTDAEAKSLLEMINRGVTAPASASCWERHWYRRRPGQPRIPIERIKRNYDETSYRQIEMEINNLNQQRPPK